MLLPVCKCVCGTVLLLWPVLSELYAQRSCCQSHDARSGDNAKDMLTTWQMHTPNNSEPPGLNFRCHPRIHSNPKPVISVRAMNKLAILKGGGVSAKDVHDFRQNHTIRIAFAEPLTKVGGV